MRPAPNKRIEAFRVQSPGYESAPDGNSGAFVVPCGDVALVVIASDGAGWDHVSVSLWQRCPTWPEMEYIRSLFFSGDETVMQLSPRRDRRVNVHKFCLHLWRPQHAEIPVPPEWMV